MKKKLLVFSLVVLTILSATLVYTYRQTTIDTSKIHLARAMSSRNLYWGARGNDVKEVQTKLKRWGYLKGSVDSIYGENTYRAIINFQNKNGLVADGIVGPRTYAALGINVTKAEPSKSVNNNDNIYMLARAIHGEARGEVYIGKVAVAAVILNRVEHPSFPNSIASVIYQPGAFTAVSDGQINLSPDQESLKAAKDAMNGWDPTYGCRYYWNPATATSKWIWSREVIVKIGKHWFGN
ncbi:spore cortex-lytic enzyme [Clostridiaceae bacterium M8S5]|nr:spore cortex-lytic enzyme [Clostridiaceae bacterium M8S5]